MLSFMDENKRLLNIHEHNFAQLATFQSNTNVFEANTNAFLNMQNQSRDFFQNDTK